MEKLTKQEQERLNYSMPVANDVKLGNILAELQNASGGGGAVDTYTKAEADGKFQPKGNYATQTALNDLIQRVTALEAK